MDVFRQIKHPRWKVNQERNEAKEEEPAQEFCNSRWVTQVGERQHVPKHLKQNHVQEETDVAESFGLWRAQKIPLGRFFRRREVAVNENRLHDRQDQDRKDQGNKDRSGVERAPSEKEIAEACQYCRTNHQVQTKIEDGIEQTTAKAGFDCVERRRVAALVKAPTFQDRTSCRQNPHRSERESDPQLRHWIFSIDLAEEINELPG